MASTQIWKSVRSKLLSFASESMEKVGPKWQLNEGQRASLRAMAERLPRNGVLIADEVGMGKTRLAAATARAVIESGGRVAVVVPPGLGYQWRDELFEAGVNAQPIIRSLWQYFAAWESADPAQHVPWAQQQVVIVSHLFANWQLGTSSHAWRWALLPEIYARWRRHRNGRSPRYFHEHEKLGDPWVERAAKTFVDGALASGAPKEAAIWLDKLLAEVPWMRAFDASAYGNQGDLRLRLEQAVGLGLGQFNLIIVDEAHKARGSESGLEKLLSRVLWAAPDVRRLGLTATPVELDSQQWLHTLMRLGVTDPANQIRDAVQKFTEAVDRVRRCPSDESVRANYLAASQQFKAVLDSYVLRRDKREDESVRAFAGQSGLPLHSYRRETEIGIDPQALPPLWKRVTCAAEALSQVAKGTDLEAEKRLRLTLGNGHGIASLVDETLRHEVDDKAQIEEDESGANVRIGDLSPDANKRAQRAVWWRNVIVRALGSGDASLFEHPAISAAVTAIESDAANGEKVLVFGRFTRPMKALASLLNAREMLRRLASGQSWPHSKVPDGDWPAVIAAHRQLCCTWELSQPVLNDRLKQQYGGLESLRTRFRAGLLDQLEIGLRSEPCGSLFASLFAALKKTADPAKGEDGELAKVARALLALLPDHENDHEPDHIADAFRELVQAAQSGNEGDFNGDGKVDEKEAAKLWVDLLARIDEEFSRTEGSFARVMNGETRHDTRRFLQLAFNRAYSLPRVLIAQSVVGREGLNLHRACRVVVLLHPEWNPGVVEQQIGRVDRVGSRWAELCQDASAAGISGSDFPRIEIRPVVFKGTYDEQNWSVLRRRWDDLRAQLHGVIIPPSEAKAYEYISSVIDEINAMAPSFSPVREDPAAGSADRGRVAAH